MLRLTIDVGGGGAGEVGINGGLLGIQRGFREVMDDATMNALFDYETKRFPSAQIG
ncbi:hypothetical protein [Accumulibacter sp.]|uniref:hypothetical protein n=1 Tax=Accumulibacter sp. TaxID=2053492 RepID=UPI0028C4377C|nr:hypothetical protein [Accumulibacter sp.]